jgi:hypothetical protein
MDANWRRRMEIGAGALFSKRCPLWMHLNLKLGIARGEARVRDLKLDAVCHGASHLIIGRDGFWCA